MRSPDCPWCPHQPRAGDPLTCRHCHQEEDAPAPVHAEGGAVRASVGEGVMVGAVRTQTGPYLTKYTSDHLHIHEAEYLELNLGPPPKRGSMTQGSCTMGI